MATAVQLVIALSSQTSALVAPSALLAAAAAAAGLYVLLRHRDSAFGLTLVWALVAVFEQSQSATVRHTAVAGIAALLLGCLASVLPRRPAAPAEAAAWEERQPLRSENNA